MNLDQRNSCRKKISGFSEDKFMSFDTLVVDNCNLEIVDF